jgi:FAD:protein FMN transferase
MHKIFCCVILLASVSACLGQNKELISISGLTMGTTYSVKLIPNDTVLDKSVLHTDIEKILADINQAMSTYINDSELSRFNQAKVSDWLNLSEDLYSVIEHANDVSLLTNGAFDVTVGPLVNLWGFGPDQFTQEIPSDLVIQSIMKHTGYEKLAFNKSSSQISKSDPDLYIDLSAIAKGFAVDKIASYLDKQTIQNYLVEIGGELNGKGTNANQQAWQIGIERAYPLERSVQRIINLDNLAMATSGDYRNYYEKEGVRYSHTINPLTGKPITHNLASVTVLTKSTMHADALATAFMVLGAEKTISLANKLNIAVYIIIKTEAGFEEQYNDYFKPYLSNL